VLLSRTVRPKAANRRIRSIAVAVRTTSGNRRVVTLRARFTAVPRGSKVVVTAHVMHGRTVVATRTRTITAARARGLHTISFGLTLPDAAYVVRGTAVVVSGGSAAHIERLTRKLRFRAR
jgi:hypothetical protein